MCGRITMTNREKELRKRKKNNVTWEEREEMAYIQESNFKEQQLESNLEKIKKYIFDFLEISKTDDIKLKKYQIESKIESQEVQVKFVKNKIEQVDLTKNTSDIEGKKYRRSITDKIKDTENFSGNIHYVWLAFREDGMLMNIGRTTTKNNDLFYKFNSLGKGNQNIILRTTYGTDVFKEYENTLNNYLKQALIVPIYPSDISGESNIFMGKIASRIESELGEYLIGENIPIFNFYSHKY